MEPREKREMHLQESVLGIPHDKGLSGCRVSDVTCLTLKTTFTFQKNSVSWRTMPENVPSTHVINHFIIFYSENNFINSPMVSNDFTGNETFLVDTDEIF